MAPKAPTASEIIKGAFAHHGQGRLGEAEAGYRQALALEPNNADALNLLGVLALQAGNAQAAAEFTGRAVNSKPDNPEYRANLGAALMAMNQIEPARQHLETALKQKPGHPGANRTYGILLSRSGDLGGARKHLQKALKKEPGNVETLGELALVEVRNGKPAAAIKHLRHALKRQPGNPIIMLNLGGALLKSGRAEDALKQLDASIAIRPDHPLSHHNRAKALTTLGRTDDAVQAYRRVLEIDPASAMSIGNLANLLLETQLEPSVAEAIALFKSALEHTAPSGYKAKAHFNLARALRVQGALDEACIEARRALDLDPGLGRAFSQLVEMEPTQPGDALVKRTLEALKALPAQSAEAMDIGYGLATVFDKVGEAEQAFAHVAKASKIKRAEVSFSERKDAQMFQQIRDTFDTDLLKELPPPWPGSDRPIFIIGMPRSGTSLLEQMLASHTDVYGAGELPHFSNIAEEAMKAGTIQKGADFKSIGQAYLDATADLPGKFVTDKMPQNYLYAGLIALALPGARILHTNRNAMDTCLSNFMTYFSGAQSFSYDLAELGGRYRRYADLMAHWHEVMPGRIFDVPYEDLVGKPETTLKRVVDHLGLEWQDTMLDFHKTERTVATASASQVRKPVYQSSTGRWRAYKAHLGPLMDALGPKLADD